MSNSRRRFLQRAGWLAATAWGVPSVGRSAEVGGHLPGATPRHVIHLVADGTSHGTITLGDCFSRLARQRGLRWMELQQRPEAALAWVNMRSLNSLVTDSAAAASSWGSGSRVVNGVLNQLPDGRNLRTLYSVFGEAGWKRGLVTTTEITHATPAGFAINASSRGTSDAIAAQYLERKIEVLLGGGKKFFETTQRTDKRDLLAEFRAQGYATMFRTSDLASASLEKRWLGVFASGHLPYTLDQMGSRDLLTKVPTLAQMTSLALKKLRREEHFILQVEGGRVDHAAHACDIATALRDLVAFDEALEVCLDFQREVPDTLLVLTVDHGTGNPGLNGTGTQYKDSVPLFAHCLRVSRSFSEMAKDLEKLPTATKVQRIIREHTAYRVSDEKAGLLVTFLAKKGKTTYEQMNSASAQLGQVLANYVGVGWASGAHTADYVPLVAVGPGAERFRGFLQNTDVFHQYLALGGIDFRNPEAPLLAEGGPSPAEVESAADYC